MLLKEKEFLNESNIPKVQMAYPCLAAHSFMPLTGILPITELNDNSILTYMNDEMSVLNRLEKL